MQSPTVRPLILRVHANEDLSALMSYSTKENIADRVDLKFYTAPNGPMIECDMRTISGLADKTG